MRHSDKIIITVLSLLLLTLNVNSEIRTGINYQIPIDYSVMNEKELSTKAEFYYNNALKLESAEISEDMTNALNLYSMLSNISPDNIIYALRLGKLYEILNKDRYAKGNYYRAMGINQSRPEPYYYLGEYFYKKEQYRRALKMFNKASDRGYKEHAETKAKINDILKRLGKK